MPERDNLIIKGLDVILCFYRRAFPLVLTKKGCSRSKWKLSEFFKNVSMSYHAKTNWKENYFQSANRGKEFVVTSSKDITNWVYDLILNCIK